MKILFLRALFLAASASFAVAQTNSDNVRFKLITLDPGHFHASLVQKFMYADVDPVVHVYAPVGDDLEEHLKRIERFNSRSGQPTHWEEKIYAGPDFLPKMVAEKAGNVVVISGNNLSKADYILESVRAGLNVLADKPMAITPADYEKLQLAFAVAATNRVLIYDIMTERYEITTQLQRELSQQKESFGTLIKGSPHNPAIEMKSVHYFSKAVAGAPLKRPEWFFDVRQQGEGITDVATHLVDLVQWEAFPGRALHPSDIHVSSARRWATPITSEQFKRVTGADSFPAFLSGDMKDGSLQVYANGEFTYRLGDTYAKVFANWDFEAPLGSGDTHYSIMRGTKAKLIIRQGEEQEFKPVLYVEKVAEIDELVFEETLKKSIAALQGKYSGVSIRRDRNGWRIIVPEKYEVGHEAHFSQVTENFLRYLRDGKLPDWEVPNMLAKYETTMSAYRLSR